MITPQSRSRRRTSSVEITCAPTSSATPRARVDLPVPGLPPTSANRTVACCRCWVAMIRWRTASAAASGLPWENRTHSTFARTTAR
ncbi:Uncharacterised protein [Mycobacterium tuberculosis]|nr:Uncharacterised protein [Mycobacterium tuberculosis]